MAVMKTFCGCLVTKTGAMTVLVVWAVSLIKLIANIKQLRPRLREQLLWPEEAMVRAHATWAITFLPSVLLIKD